jgi:hypothetical protein
VVAIAENFLETVYISPETADRVDAETPKRGTNHRKRTRGKQAEQQ